MERELILYEFQEYERFLETCLTIKDWKEDFQIYTPLPDEDLSKKFNIRTTRISILSFIGGIVGILVGIALQYEPNVLSYPQNIGGRPLASWPTFTMICFELCILFASFGVVCGFVLMNRYPRFDRAVFSSPAFNERSHKNYFICTTREIAHVEADSIYYIPALT